MNIPVGRRCISSLELKLWLSVGGDFHGHGAFPHGLLTGRSHITSLYDVHLGLVIAAFSSLFHNIDRYAYIGKELLQSLFILTLDDFVVLGFS